MAPFNDPSSPRAKEMRGGQQTSIVLGTNLKQPSRPASQKSKSSKSPEPEGNDPYKDDKLNPDWDPEAYQMLVDEQLVEEEAPPSSTKKDE